MPRYLPTDKKRAEKLVKEILKWRDKGYLNVNWNDHILEARFQQQDKNGKNTSYVMQFLKQFEKMGWHTDIHTADREMKHYIAKHSKPRKEWRESV